MSETILLVDNARDYVASVAMRLELEGYRVATAHTVTDGQEMILSLKPDLVLADLRAGDDDNPIDITGLGVAKAASDQGIPCIMVTAFPNMETLRDALRRRTDGAHWAVDYVYKGAGVQSVLDAIRSALRARGPRRPGAVTVGELSVDLTRETVALRGEELALTALQYQLLSALCERDGGVCSHAELVKRLYGQELTEYMARQDRALQRLVARLRAILESDPRHPEYIVTVRGRGFRLGQP